jgi:hypothetical protein
MFYRIDVIHPSKPNQITLKDIKKSKHCAYFFNYVFNFDKFSVYEKDSAAPQVNYQQEDADEEIDFDNL